MNRRTTFFRVTKLSRKGPLYRSYLCALNFWMPISCVLLPSRLNLQHRIIIKAFDDKLVMAPVSLKEGDRVLESGAGTGEPSAISLQGATDNATIIRHLDVAVCSPDSRHCPDTRSRHQLTSFSRCTSHKHILLRQLYHVST